MSRLGFVLFVLFAFADLAFAGKPVVAPTKTPRVAYCSHLFSPTPCPDARTVDAELPAPVAWLWVKARNLLGGLLEG